MIIFDVLTFDAKNIIVKILFDATILKTRSIFIHDHSCEVNINIFVKDEISGSCQF